MILYSGDCAKKTKLWKKLRRAPNASQKNKGCDILLTTFERKTARLNSILHSNAIADVQFHVHFASVCWWLCFCNTWMHA